MSYGFSIKLNEENDFDFNPATFGLSFTEDEDNLVQVVKSILKTIQGERSFFPTFGVDYRSIMQKNVVYDNLKHEIQTALVRDPRIRKVQNIRLNRPERGVLDIYVEIVTNSNDVFKVTEGISW